MKHLKDQDSVEPSAPDPASPSGFRSLENFWYGSHVMREPPIAIGATVAEKYVVERVLGEGGMGIVLAARHRELDQRVAIKFLLPEIAQRGVAAERFRREARAVASMRSEHICRVLDVGTLSDGIPFMVMEYLDGCDLSQELERRERLPYAEAVSYVMQACEALSEAHRSGIIHRDLKPANLFLEQRGQVARRLKVLDFGVSKSLLEAQKSLQALTQTANMVGSPLYMSPEQLESSRDVDARADIWGLGVVLYELISGQPPFAANSIPQLIAAVINERPRRLAPELEVPPELEAVITRMLAKDRRDRPSSVDELMDMLEPYAAPAPSGFRTTQLGAHGPTDRPRSGTPHGVRSTTRTSQTPLSWDRNDKSSGSRKRVAVGAILVALAAVAAFIAYSYRGADAEPGVAKPMPQHSDEPVLGTSAASTVEPLDKDKDKDKEIPRGVSPDSPPAEPAAEAVAPQAQPAAAPVPAPVIEPAPKPAAAAAVIAPKAPAARPTAPVLTPVPAAKPAASPAAPNVHGAPPRGQISDFGGRR